jgi:hypothetical protein
MNHESDLIPVLRYILPLPISLASLRPGPLTRHESGIVKASYSCRRSRTACSDIRAAWANAEAGRPHVALELLTSLLDSESSRSRLMGIEYFLVQCLIHNSSDSTQAYGRLPPAFQRASDISIKSINVSCADALMRAYRTAIARDGPDYVRLNNLACLLHLTGRKEKAWRMLSWAYEISHQDRVVGLNLAAVSIETNHFDTGSRLLGDYALSTEWAVRARAAALLPGLGASSA